MRLRLKNFLSCGEEKFYFSKIFFVKKKFYHYFLHHDYFRDKKFAIDGKRVILF